MTSHNTKILLIRHGQTDWNKAGRWQGHADIPLNDLGKEQARHLAKRLATWSIDAFLSSDLKRAYETAVIVANPHKLQIQSDPIWRERHIGELQGLTGETGRKKYPEVWARSENGILEPPNGETFSEMQARAMTAFNQLLALYQNGTIVVVSHGQLLHVLLAQVMGIEAGHYGRFSMRGNTGLSVIEVESNRQFVTRINDTAHLEERESQ